MRVRLLLCGTAAMLLGGERAGAQLPADVKILYTRFNATAPDPGLDVHGGNDRDSSSVRFLYRLKGLAGGWVSYPAPKIAPNGAVLFVHDIDTAGAHTFKFYRTTDGSPTATVQAGTKVDDYGWTRDGWCWYLRDGTVYETNGGSTHTAARNIWFLPHDASRFVTVEVDSYRLRFPDQTYGISNYTFLQAFGAQQVTVDGRPCRYFFFRTDVSTAVAWAGNHAMLFEGMTLLSYLDEPDTYMENGPTICVVTFTGSTARIETLNCTGVPSPDGLRFVTETRTPAGGEIGMCYPNGVRGPTDLGPGAIRNAAYSADIPGPWSNDGTRLLFDDRGGRFVMAMNPDGSNAGVIAPVGLAMEGLPYPFPTTGFQAQWADVAARPMIVDVTAFEPPPALVHSHHLIGDRARLAGADGRAVDGVAADGACALLLRVRTRNAANDVTVRFSLDTADGASGTTPDTNETGTLAPLTAQDSGARSLDVPVAAADPVHAAFALYRAPLDFARAGTGDSAAATRDMTIAVWIDGLTHFIPVRVFRPPVFLIHGLWSRGDVWKDFPPIGTFQDARFDVTRADYFPKHNRHIGEIISSGFSIKLQLDACLERFRHQHLAAASAADVIAHSLGGLISRALPFYEHDWYFDDNSFGRGKIHKLITFDTPHRGSEFADLLSQGIAAGDNDLARYGAMRGLERIMQLVNSDPKLAANAPDYEIRGGAIEDLQTTSGIVTNLNRPVNLAMQPRIHAVISRATAVELNANIWLPLVAYDATGLAPRNPFDLFGSLFGGANDLIVSDGSQGGVWYTAPNTTVLIGLVHSDGFFSSTAVISAAAGTGALAASLLNAPATGTLFARPMRDDGAPNPQTASIPPPDPRPLHAPAPARHALTFLSPPADTIVNGGTSVTVSIGVAPGFHVRRVYLATFGGVALDTAPPFTFSVPVPPDAPLGRVTCMAAAVDSLGHFAVDQDTNSLAAELQFVCATSWSLTGIRANDTAAVSLMLDSMVLPLRVTGTFADGVSRDITRDATTTFAVSDSTVATVDSGVVTPRGVGRTTIVVASGFLTDSIVVTVYRHNDPPTADAGADVEVPPGATVHLDASRSRDPDGDGLTYAWTLESQPEESTATLTATDSVRAVLVTDSVGYYVAKLVVTDAAGQRDSAYVAIGAGTPTGVAERNDAPPPRAITLDCRSYPNPVSGAAMFLVEGSRRVEGTVSLHIFNALGCTVATFDRGETTPDGTMRFRWDTGALPNGLYRYEVRTRDGAVRGRLLVVK